MWTFTPTAENYAIQKDESYADLIKKIRSIYCGKPVRIENGVVTATILGQNKVIGHIE